MFWRPLPLPKVGEEGVGGMVRACYTFLINTFSIFGPFIAVTVSSRLP
jgi:hypothetical protein